MDDPSKQLPKLVYFNSGIKSPILQFGTDLRNFAHTSNQDGQEFSDTFAIIYKKKLNMNKTFPFSYFTKDVYLNTVKEILKYRSENDIVRNDFFDYMYKSHQSNETIAELIAIHAATVYVDGVETAALTMAFVLYELANDSDVQATLRREIRELLEDNGCSYEKLMSAEYLDCVISVQETVRLHPPLPFMTRICTKQFTFEKTNRASKELTIDVGTPIIVPIRDLHYDSQYYPNPTKFDLKTNPKWITQNVLRCLLEKVLEEGYMLEYMELKLGIAKMISNYDLSTSKETLLYESVFFLDPIGGLWIKLKRLSNI